MGKIIKDKSPTKRRISSRTICKVIGAKEIKFIITGQAPISLLALRHYLVDMNKLEDFFDISCIPWYFLGKFGLDYKYPYPIVGRNPKFFADAQKKGSPTPFHTFAMFFNTHYELLMYEMKACRVGIP